MKYYFLILFLFVFLIIWYFVISLSIFLYFYFPLIIEDLRKKNYYFLKIRVGLSVMGSGNWAATLLSANFKHFCLHCPCLLKFHEWVFLAGDSPDFEGPEKNGVSFISVHMLYSVKKGLPFPEGVRRESLFFLVLLCR